jgi:hypothetical protein
VRGEPGGTEADYVGLWQAIETDVLNRMLITNDLDRIIAEGRFTAEVELLVAQGHLTPQQGEAIRGRSRRSPNKNVK